MGPIDLKRLRNLEYAGVKVPKNLIEQTKNAVAKYGTDFSHSLGRRNPGLDSRIEKLKKQIGSIYDEILQLEQNYKY